MPGSKSQDLMVKASKIPSSRDLESTKNIEIE